jgi:hypothetical protein
MSLELFAKLLAAENISLVRGNFKTASFDLARRVVRVPNYKNMHPTEEDMLVFHEIGHALYTPQEYIDANKRHQRKPNFHQYLNVVEDARIERKVKETYPGSKKTFFNAYQMFMDRDFFGVKREEVNDMIFIDRVNLHFKVGFLLGIKFSPEEQVLIDRVEAASAFPDALSAALAIYKFASKKPKKQEPKKEEQVSMPAAPAPEAEEQESGEVATPGEESDGGEASPAPAAPEEGEGEKAEDKKPESSNGEAESEEGEAAEESTPEPVTEGEAEDKKEEEAEKKAPSGDKGAGSAKEEFEEVVPEASKTTDHLAELLAGSVDQKEVNYVDPVLAGDFNIYPFSFILSRVKASSLGRDQSKLNEMRASAKKAASYLHREFEIKKAADMHARTMQGQSGQLDTSRLASYKTASNLFKKYNIEPKGKNHGVVALVDFSGSMADLVTSACMEIYTLASFCKMAGIPFEFYAFTDRLKNQSNENFLWKDYDATVGKNCINGSYGALYQIATSSASWVDVENVLQYMMDGFYNVNNLVKMGGTPLCESLLLMCNKLIPEFRNAHNLEKVTFVTMTDGESNGTMATDAYGQALPLGENTLLRDMKSGKTFALSAKFKSNNFSMGVLEYMKFKMPWLKTIGFFIVKKMDYDSLTKFCRAYSEEMHYSKLVWRNMYDGRAVELMKTKKDETISTSVRGYDSMMIFCGDLIKTGFHMKQMSSDSKSTALANEFKVAMKNGIRNKVLLSQVAKVMA